MPFVADYKDAPHAAHLARRGKNVFHHGPRERGALVQAQPRRQALLGVRE
jgi:hypothetical protein